MIRFLPPLFAVMLFASCQVNRSDGGRSDRTPAEPAALTYTHLLIDSTRQKWGDWAEPDWLRYFGQDAADVDRDGDVDILGGRYLYLNPGGDMSEQWERVALDDNVDGIFLMDVDGDSFADLIAMALPNIYWYEATAQDARQWSRHKVAEVPATSHVNSQGFERAQVIPGGPEEILIAGDGDVYLIRIPENPGDGGEWTTDLIADNTSDEGIGVGDLDGDGDLDLAAGRRPEGEAEPTILVSYLNPGDGTTPWPSTEIGTSLHPIDRVEVADIDGDGRSDIVVTEERYPGEEPDGNLWWFEQPDRDTAWTRHHIVTQYSMNNLDLADTDGDGDTDILTNEHKGPRLELQWWLNDGRGNFTKRVVDAGHENHLGTQLADLDRDGDLDIFGGAWDNYRYFHVWRNDAVSTTAATGAHFREYHWSPTGAGLSEEYLRVGGKLDYRTPEANVPAQLHRDGAITLFGDLPLASIERAEAVIQRVQSHEDTRELEIQFNGGDWIRVPEPATILGKATDFMFHANLTIPVPPSTLRPAENTFRLRVAEEQSWGWPQNLIYGVTLRTYLSEVGPQKFRIAADRAATETYDLHLEGDLSQIERVEYVGRYSGIDPAGTGLARSDHYRLHGDTIDGHLGTSTRPPFAVSWNTEWMADQRLPLLISARVHTADGTIYLAKPTSVVHDGREQSVYLAQPGSTPAFWVTRSGAYDQSFDLPFDPATLTDARLIWNSWSPCYVAGISMNGRELANPDPGPCYRAAWRTLDVPTGQLVSGRNVVTTAKTPLHDGQMVHGMEVQYPGFLLKVRRPVVPAVSITEGTYEERPHFIITTPGATYYLDRAGGGLSRMIDTLGNDWIAYRSEPRDEYPASAAAAYRGLPNLVFGGSNAGAGHPGHDRMDSRQSGANRITSETTDGQWSWDWTFDERSVTLTMSRVPADVPYWFLYEGTPGGSWDPEQALYRIGESAGLVRAAPDFFKNESSFQPMNRLVVGDRDLDHALLLEHLTGDPLPLGVLGYLGNTEAGVGSPEGMIVAGFGRNENTQPLLKGLHTFRIGFVPLATVAR